MRPFHDTPQVRDLHVGVALGGGEALVAQEGLDVADVGASPQEVGRRAVAEGVARDVLLDTIRRASASVRITRGRRFSIRGSSSAPVGSKRM